MTMQSTETVLPRTDSITVAEEREEQRLSRPSANLAATLRIAIGLIYVWAFTAALVGINYTNTVSSAPGGPPGAPDWWHFSVNTSKGYLTSGFQSSPTAGYLKGNAHGPLAFLPQHLPDGINNFMWMFALGGLAIALTLGIFMRIAGWGGLALNLLMWFSAFPPARNPVLDGEHLLLGFGILLLMFLGAGDHWGLGRWWKARTPAWLH